MATRRRRGVADYGRSNARDEVNDPFILDSSSDSDDLEMLESYGDSAQSEGFSFSDDQDLKRELYKEVLLDYGRLKKLKRKLKLSVSHEKKKIKSVTKSKDAFTRFSVTAFSSVP